MGLRYSTQEIQDTLDKVQPLEEHVHGAMNDAMNNIRIDAANAKRRIELLESCTLRRMGEVTAEGLMSVSSATVGYLYKVTTNFTIGKVEYAAGAYVLCIKDFKDSAAAATLLEGYWDVILGQRADGTIDLTGYATEDFVRSLLASYATEESVQTLLLDFVRKREQSFLIGTQNGASNSSDWRSMQAASEGRCWLVPNIETSEGRGEVWVIFPVPSGTSEQRYYRIRFSSVIGSGDNDVYYEYASSTQVESGYWATPVWAKCSFNDIDVNRFVTKNSAETITGVKTFQNDAIAKSGNESFYIAETLSTLKTRLTIH